MSKISQDFINNLGFLYENIHVKDQDFLNEESEYYEEESAELAEDIILSLALSMFSEGYTAETFLKFLANSDEEVILEKYLSTDITFISEETIYSDFVEEQLELLEAGGVLGLLARGAKAIAGAAKATKGVVKAGVTKAATAGVERRVGKQLLGRKGIDIAVPGSATGRSGSSMERTTAALEKLAKSKAQKSGISVPSGKLDARQSTELLKQARTAKAIRGVKDVAKTALVGGLGVLGGYTGAKLSGAGSGSQQNIKTAPSKTPTPSGKSDIKGSQTPTKPSTPAAPSKPSGSVKASPTSAKPKAPDKAPEGETPMQKWARLHPNLAAKVKPGQSGYEEISATRTKPSSYEKQDQTPTTGNPEAKIDTAAVEADIKKEQERLKKKAAETASTTKEAYDLVLEYLIDTDQVETLEEAHYVMLEMDAETIGDIVEAKYGTAKGRKALAKKVRAGKDVGKKGGGFEKIVTKASKKYGKERATKIAAAAMWKNLGK